MGRFLRDEAPASEATADASQIQGAPFGEGGRYIIGDDGVRRLVERGEDRVIRSVQDANPDLK